MRLLDRLIRRDAGYWEGMASGASIMTTSYGSPDREAILPQIAAGAAAAFGTSSVVFAAEAARMLVFAQAELKLQAKDDKHLYTDGSLGLLQEPFGPGTGTAELLARMEQDAGLAGNSYTWGPPGGDLLVRLRPDWTTIVSEVADAPGGGWYRRVTGYWVEPPKDSRQGEPFLAPADEVAHYAPVPDPAASFRGMSWLTPALRDITGDSGLADYKVSYLRNAASPNLLIKYDQRLQPSAVDAVRERVQSRYTGDGAFGTLVLDQGADATIIGSNLQQMDFSNVQQSGTDRVLAASMVPGVLIGLEPLRGAGRGYQESVQKLANMWARPSWQRACGVLSRFVPGLPGGSRLWYDASGIALLQDGELEKGQSALVKAQALLALRQSGYDPMSAIAAVDSMDLTQLMVAAAAPAPPNQPVQHMLGQQSPGVVASPLPPALGRLPVGSTSPGDGGNSTRPVPRPSSARRSEGNGHG